MSSRRPPIPRTLATRPQAGTGHAPQPARHDAARLVRHTLIDFSSLPLPADVRLALAQAFWGHIGGHSDRSIVSYWKSILPFARFAADQGVAPPEVTVEAMAALQSYEWPGNVRQLENVVFRAVTMSDRNVLEAADLELAGNAVQTPDALPTGGNGSAGAATDGWFAAVEHCDRELLARLWPQYPSSRRLAAQLGTSHTMIAKKLRKYGIGRES